ncbi:MAG TPA: DUF2171 domain-containing protein [Candidatus Limnocylindrales bacterium]
MDDVVSDIQPGWQVVSSEGENVGKVVEVYDHVVHVKQAGLFGGEVHVPQAAIETAEDNTVRLTMTKRELEAGAG